jgi:lysophosphatidylglycerol acyltransferase 1
LTTTKDANKPVKLLVVANHQESGDVPLLFQMFSCYPKNILLWVMDAMFKKTHFGWVSYVHGDYFIKPGTFEPTHLTKHCLQNMDKNTIILFPEGGFRFKKVESSKRYSDRMNLPHLKNVVWPRFGAFQDLTDKRLEVTHIVDVTIIYPKLEKAISLPNILFGTDRTDVYLIYRVYDIAEIEPTSEWLNELWKRKDEMIQRFYDNKETFIQKESKIKEVELKWNDILLVNIFYFTLTVIYVRVFQVLLSIILETLF